MWFNVVLLYGVDLLVYVLGFELVFLFNCCFCGIVCVMGYGWCK